MKLLLILILMVINYPIYKKIFSLVFTSREDFYESLRYVFTPDIISLFKGEYVRDWYGEMKVQFFIFLCIGLIFIEYLTLNWVFRIIGN